MINNITITQLRLNKGIDVEGIEIIDNIKVGKYFGSGLSINTTLQLLNKYGNGKIIVKFGVYEGTAKKDKLNYERRIKKLLKNCKYLKQIEKTKNVFIDGYIFPNEYKTVLFYERGAK